MFVKESCIPTAEEICAQFPLSEALSAKKAEGDRLAAEVFSGKSGRFLVVIGAAFLQDEASALEHAENLGKIAEKVKDKLILIPRFKAPALRADGQSAPDGVAAQIRALRSLYLRCMDASSLACAGEMTFPESFAYFADVLAYITVGARGESLSQRLAASGAHVPVGVEISAGGTFSEVLDAVDAVQQPHVFAYCGHQVRTDGDPYAHALLRGGADDGCAAPDYHYETVMELIEAYEGRQSVRNPAVVIDAGRNSSQKPERQIRICREIMRNRRSDADFCRIVKGIMLDGLLCAGQPQQKACLGGADTERLLYEIAEW